MPQTAAQICTRARQIARCPGFTSQSGQTLNDILRDLCQNQDLELARKTQFFSFTGASGPYPMNADFLRTRKGKIFYIYNGVPYFPTPIELDEYQQLVQQAGFSDFPRVFATDMGVLPPTMFFWPPPSIAVNITNMYYSQMADIGSGAYGAADNQPPETSTIIPWFPSQNYLLTELAGRLMQDTNDPRDAAFRSDDEKVNPQGSGVILRKYLMMKDDPEGKVNTVELDRRRFGKNFARLPNTKNIGW